MTMYKRAIVTSLGPITGALPSTGTAPLTAQGILNLATLGTTPVLVYQAPSNAAGRVARVEITVISNANVAWTTVVGGAAAPTVTALGAGAATEGNLIFGGGGASKDFNIADGLDLYVVASAANTVVNITVLIQ